MAQNTMADAPPPPPPTLLTLAGLRAADLPAATATAAELTPLVTALLREALPLLDSVTSTPSAWTSKGSKRFAASAAPVALSARVVGAGGDSWACRRSVHADAAAGGSASWAEFARGLRDEHAASEARFTPTVLAHRDARTWPAAAGVAPVVAAGGAEQWRRRRWGRCTLALVEAKHAVPGPFRPRVFAVVQLVARALAEEGGGEERDEERDEFVVVSAPVSDLAAHGELAVLSRERGVVVGAYAAVERVRRRDGDVIEWVMAVASDARGVLPLFVQAMVLPGEIAKDVALFLGWVAREREGKAVAAEEVEPVGGRQQSGHGQAAPAA